MKKISKTFDINGKTITFEMGELAQLATSSVFARMGDTTVLATVTMGRNDTTLDYFPLSVDYVERLYAGGKIKGSRWVKREGRPTDDAILTGRLIDRSIRPLFPKELKKDVQVIVNVLSVMVLMILIFWLLTRLAQHYQYQKFHGTVQLAQCVWVY